MAKKKKNKKKDSLAFFMEMLEKNQKHINITENEKTVSLKDKTESSIEAARAVPFDAVIPVSSADAAKEKSSEAFKTTCYYTTPIFKLFEVSIASTVRQTMVMTVDANDMETLFEPGMNETITNLMGKTNLSMVVKDLAKLRKKFDKWAGRELDETPFDMFVITIPDLILFTNKIRKDEASDALLFNLVIQVVKTRKSIAKIKKKGNIEDLSKFVIKCTIENIKNLGLSNVIMELNDDMSEDYYELAENWAINLKGDEDLQKMMNHLIFTVMNSTGYAIVSTKFFDGWMK